MFLNNMEILGIIPARGGSKSIPMKNVALLAGKPLLFYTCEAAKESKCLTRTILSTDSQKIADAGREYGVEVPFIRPAEYAQDDTSSLAVVRHALIYLEKEEGYRPDIAVLLQPTSPLRRAIHIDGTVAALLEQDVDSAVSVVEVPHQFGPDSVMVLENGRLKPYKTGPPILRRQDKQRVYARNGPAVLVMKRTTVMEKNLLYGDTTALFLMTPEDSVDIDAPSDLSFAEYLLAKRSV